MPGGRFSLEERVRIEVGLSHGMSFAELGRRLGRHRGSVGREVRRNRLPRQEGYRAVPAQAAAMVRAPRPKRRKLTPGSALQQRVIQGFKKGWSPQQISCRLLVEHPDDRSWRVSHETIYRAWFIHGKGQLREALKTALTEDEQALVRLTRAHRRRPRSAGTPLRSRILNAVPIGERPPEIADRLLPGDWEGDCATRGRTG